MAIQVTDQSGRRDQEGGRARVRRTQGAPRRRARRRLHGLLVRVRVGGQRAAPEDKVLSFEDGRVRVVVDPKSFLYLGGMTLESCAMMGHGFKFENPNVKGSCGCGESVQF